jgi:hypothetical protein
MERLPRAPMKEVLREGKSVVQLKPGDVFSSWTTNEVKDE